MTLTEFLTARLDEDEAVAREDLHPDFSNPLLSYMDFGEIRIGTTRVLADVDAKRQIVTRYAEHADYDDPEDSYEHATGRIVGLGEALRLLALPFADHPDYDESWKP